MSGTWKEAGPAAPCWACGAVKWCAATADGNRVHCRRLDKTPAGVAGEKKEDKAGESYWVYHPNGRPQAGPAPTRSHTEGAAKAADAAERDRVYRRLLNALPSSRIVTQFLDRRGVPGTSALRTRYRYHRLPGRSKTAKALVEAGLEPLMARTPGFFVREKDGAAWWTIAGSPGVAIPVRDYRGRVVGVLLRPDDPKRAKYLWLTSGMHGGAKARRVPHVPVFDGDKSTVRLTEGVVKADVATELGGVLTVGLPGLYCEGVARTLKKLKAKTVRLAFDADGANNPNVARAIAHHFKELSREFAVELERWDARDGKGIDDLLANNKTPELVTGEAVTAAVEAMVRGAEAAASGGRPVVRVSTNESETVRAVVEALAAGDGGLYQKDGELVEVVQPSAACAADPRPRIVPLTAANIRTRITRVVDLRQVVGAGTEREREVRVNPPAWLAGAVKDLNRWPGVRPLVAVTGSPVLRPDGTVHQTPGYDPVTGLLYVADGAYAPIPENPTLEDAKAAVGVLRSGVGQFPWKEESDLAAWLSEVVTVAVRHAVAGACPLFFHTANAAGSGKTALARAAAVIGTGRELPGESYPLSGRKRDRSEDAEELRKLGTTAAIEGHTAFLLDNVPSGWGFGSSVLDAIVTSTVNSGRQLCTNSAPPRQAFTVWILTGNNIRPVGDTVRRSIPVRLYSSEEQPDQRQYIGPEVVTWARQERGRLFTAALTVAAAYIRAGRPDVGLKPLGSFEAWSGLVRSAVVWCGLPDPCANRGEFATEDPDRETVVDLMALIGLASPKGDPVTAADVAKKVGDEMRSSSQSNGFKVPAPAPNLDDPEKYPLASAYRRVFAGAEKPDSRRLGNLLSKHRGRVVSGKRIERKGEDRNHVALWTVERVRGPDDTAGSENDQTPHRPRNASATEDDASSLLRGLAGSDDAHCQNGSGHITHVHTCALCAHVEPMVEKDRKMTPQDPADPAEPQSDGCPTEATDKLSVWRRLAGLPD